MAVPTLDSVCKSTRGYLRSDGPAEKRIRKVLRHAATDAQQRMVAALRGLIGDAEAMILRIASGSAEARRAMPVIKGTFERLNEE